jgi:hypothetical protein
MQKITSADQLQQSIHELESRTKRQEASLKEGLKSTGQSIKQTLKPSNLLKEGISTVRNTPSIKTMAINTFIGLAAGYLTKKLIIGKSRNILKRTVGVAIQAGITKMVHNKLPSWQHKAAELLSKKNVLR